MAEPALAHDRAGSGPAVLLIHAGACDRRMWDPQWPTLTERFTAVRCDLRGFGDSPVADGRYDDADDVRALLDALDIPRASVIGASFGGSVALELATRWPERIDRLVLLCSAWSGVEPDAELRRVAAEEEALLDEGDVEGAVELSVEVWLGPEASPDARDLVRRMQRRAYELQLAAPDTAAPEETDSDPATIDASTLLVSGAHDLTHYSRVAAALAERIPRARHEELDWAGHLPGLERPQALGELVVGHLNG